LVRLITLMPEQKWTPAMATFASQYTKFIVKEQINRYLFEERMPPLGGKSARGRVAHWEQAMQGLKGSAPWDTAMSDIDLWLLASAAEMLGAHANDPELVRLDQSDVQGLESAISTGTRFFQSKRTIYPETKNFSGKVVGSASYFNGDYAAHSDMAFSAVGGAELPSAAERRSLPRVSWDSSHVYRLPIFLRALYENRKALGSEWPAFDDLQLVTNQYVYKVFTGNYSRPLFRNYFDGSDGWFRVDYDGSGFGHPPSAYCDMQKPKRPCLMPGEIMAWGELAFVNADLARLEQALVELAFNKDPGTREFREQHYFFNSPYQVNVVDGFDVYGGALYFMVAENADMIPARNTSADVAPTIYRPSE